MCFFPGFASVWRFYVLILVVSLVHKTGLSSICDGLVKYSLDLFPTLLAVNTSVALNAVICFLVSPNVVACSSVSLDVVICLSVSPDAVALIRNLINAQS